MDIEQQFELGHLLLHERKCRSCGELKNLIDGFYRTRKNRSPIPSSYSYECKVCTIKRIIKSRKDTVVNINWEYPDW